ncbi:MAG: hypothetical protein AB7U73_05630 [Pirellulales bacterium]
MPSLPGMRAGGYYDQHSSGQRASIEAVFGWIDALLPGIPAQAADRPFAMADFGCSEGANSLRIVAHVRRALAALGQGDRLWATFNDLPSNNFNRLFDNLARQELLPAQKPGLYHAAVAGSFYGPLLPRHSLQFGLSFNSLVWLDQLPPAPVPDFVIYPGPTPHRADVQVSAAAVAAFAEQARSDLLRFLAARADELVPGGKLLVCVPARDAGHSTSEGLYDLLHDSCVDMVRRGLLDEQAYRDFVMPVYFRRLDEMVDPLAGVPHLAERLAVERAEIVYVATPFVDEFRRTGDRAIYAEAFVGFLQAFSEPVLRAGLPSAESVDVVASIYDRARERLRVEPERYPFEYIQAACVYARR